MIYQALLGLAALGYLLAATGFHAQPERTTRWLQMVLASFGLHSVGLLVLTLQRGHLPLTHMSEVIATIAWLLTALYVFVGHRWKVDALGTIAAPAAAVMTAFSSIALSASGPEPARGPWFFIHVGSLISSYAAFCFAAFCAVMYFVQSKRLKTKKLKMALGLPSLDTLDRLAFRFILVGFPLMVLGVVSGTMIAGWRWTWDAKETLVGVTCGVYVAYLHARLVAGWQGRRVNMLLLVAFVSVLVSLLAPGQFHRF